MDSGVILMNTNAGADSVNAYFNGLSSLLFSSSMAPVVSAFVLVIILAGVLGILSSIFKSSKSKEYREVITDMYVTGAIRKYADEDKINLDEEYKKFLKWCRKKKLQEKDLDSVIEYNLKEKVSEKNDKEIASIK